MMLSSFQVKDFRCFKDIKLDRLARVNLIGGKNNTGKTTLLEALFLSLGPNNPELLIRINVFRGIQQFKVDTDALFEGPWRWLFRTRKPDCNIEIIEIDTENQERKLKIFFEKSKTHVLGSDHTQEEVSLTSKTSTGNNENQIILRQVINDIEYDSKFFVNSKGEFEVERAPEFLHSRGVYITPHMMTRTDIESVE